MIHVLEVWGHLACFSNPVAKVERFSYPCITPSAIRGIFDAIYCKPREFRWQPRRVEILCSPNYIALRRNEVKEKASINAIMEWMAGNKDPTPIFADGNRDTLGTDEKGRTQRQTMALRDVRYRLHADIEPWPGFENGLLAMQRQFVRRATHGKCVWQPYLGCREFPAYFRLVERATDVQQPIDLDQDLGFMLYDVFDLSRPGSPDDPPKVSVFRATIRNGVLDIPHYDSREVLRASQEA